ncbi:precorrin-6A/cobalt-precorrin-6A reductase [Sulfitobacter sp. HNIBRBA3233]|uniref:precorrin-6A/cobalt-precorrin-6A reductase n=1 Tax=Sulfitobacter marinivivus TaxID=3158558 RepID=UPI0032E00D9E
MTEAGKILLLAGSFEARQLAEALAARGLPLVIVMPEPPRGRATLPQSPLLRRFGDADDMARFVKDRRIGAILDASHMFDRTQTAQAAALSAALSVPYLRLERLPWEVTGGACEAAASVSAARARIAPGARVFAATGWNSMEDFRPFPGARLLLRQTRRHDRPAPFDFVDLVFGDPPFSQADEIALFRDLRIDTLVCRNLGGRASRPKVDAAAALGLQTILVDRPALPQGITSVADVDAALAWVDAL